MSSALSRKDEVPGYRPWEPERLDGAARAGAGRLGLPTVGELERIQLAARKEGFDAGYAQAKARLEGEVARLTALFAAARREIEAAEGAAADQIVALAVEIARQLVRRTVQFDPEHIGDVVREAVRQLPLFARNGRILLNPEDAALVRASAAAEFERLGWQVIDDARLQRGDCRLDTGTTQLDAALDTRWGRVIAALGSEAPREPAGPAREPDLP